MGRHKQDRIEREEAERRAAESGGRRCLYCSSVIPYGTDLGPNGECPKCVDTLKDD